MAHYKIANWDTYQHYKQRTPPPPWIKLYTSLLSSEAWVSLDDSGRALMVACMLIGSAKGGEIPDNPAYIKRVAYLDKMPDFAPLVAFGFLEKVDMLAPCYQDASTMLAPCYTREEKRREREEHIESRKEEDKIPDSAPDGAAAVEDAELFDSISTPTKTPTSDPAMDAYLEALPLAWNALAVKHGLSKVFVDKTGVPVLEGERLKAATHLWKTSKVYRENWREAIKGISKSQFHLGTNGTGWKINIDFFLRATKGKPPNFLKFLELGKTAQDQEDERPF